jgi:multidrug efflux pump subunit AcrA (membrane-fusion protein)
MRKFITALIVIGLLVGGYFYIRTNLQVSLSALEGKMTDAYRGDLVVPITASGKIEPASVTNIKGEASGEVVEIPFEEGDMVKKGDMIVRLDRSDEQRNVDRAKADLERAKIAMERAKLTKQERQDVGLPLAKAKVDQAEARHELAKIDFDHIDKMFTGKGGGIGGAASKIEYENSSARMKEAQAALDAAEAEKKQAAIAVDLAAKEVDAAEQSVETATKQYEEAMERLSETKVLSPINGMVLARHVQVGEVIQSGKTSLTGGTVLMEIADVSRLYAVVNVDEADIGQVHQLAPPQARPGQIARGKESTGKATPAEKLVAKPIGDNNANNPGDADVPEVGASALSSTTKPAVEMVEFPEEMLDKDEMVELTVESFPDEKFYGVIERISPQSEIVQAIATFEVRIRIVSENRDKLVGLLNTQVEARFTVRSLSDVVLVSYDAIQKNPNGDGFGVYVPVQKPDQSRPEAEFRSCKFGADNSIVVHVEEGLDPGDKVYTKLPKKTEREKEEEES